MLTFSYLSFREEMSASGAGASTAGMAMQQYLRVPSRRFEMSFNALLRLRTALPCVWIGRRDARMKSGALTPGKCRCAGWCESAGRC